MQVCPPAMLVHEDPSFVTFLTCPFLQVWVCGTTELRLMLAHLYLTCHWWCGFF